MSPSPAEAVTTGASADTTRDTYSGALLSLAASSFAEVKTCSGPATSSNCTPGYARISTARGGLGEKRGLSGIPATACHHRFPLSMQIQTRPLRHDLTRHPPPDRFSVVRGIGSDRFDRPLRGFLAHTQFHLPSLWQDHRPG